MSSSDRMKAGLGGYAAALGLCMAVLLVMVAVVTWQKQEHIPSVDYQIDLAALTDVAPYQVRAPEGLPEGWVPTSTRLDTGGAVRGAENAGNADQAANTEHAGNTGQAGPVSWQLGFATPTDHHASLRMSGADPQGYIAEMTRSGEPGETVRIGGQSWRRYAGGDEGWRSLVSRRDDVTVVVTGTAGYEELRALADSLHPVDAKAG